MRRTARLLPFVLLLPAACGDPDGDDVVPANHIPTVLASLAAGPDGGRVEIAFTLADEDAETCTVVVEWSSDGFRYIPASLVDPIDLENLAASADGEPYTVTWAWKSDVTDADPQVAWVRLTPYDGQGRGPSAHVEVPFPPPGDAVTGTLLSTEFATPLVPLDDLVVTLVLVDLESDTEPLPPRGPTLGAGPAAPPAADGEPWSYTLALPEVAPEDHYQHYSIQFGVDSLLAYYVPAAFVDADGDAAWGEGEALAATSLRHFVVALDYAGSVPGGAPEPGWYETTLDAETYQTADWGPLDSEVDLHLWSNEVLSGAVAGEIDASWFAGSLELSYRLAAYTCTVHGVVDELTSVPLLPEEDGAGVFAPLPFELRVPEVPGDHLNGPYFDGAHYLAAEPFAVYVDTDGNETLDPATDPLVGMLQRGSVTGPLPATGPLEGLVYFQGEPAQRLVYYYAVTGCGIGWSRTRFDPATGAVVGCSPLEEPVAASYIPFATPTLAACVF